MVPRRTAALLADIRAMSKPPELAAQQAELDRLGKDCRRVDIARHWQATHPFNLA
mgnify:CR=1 FL=1